MKNELRKIGEELARLARRFSEIIAGTSKGEGLDDYLSNVIDQNEANSSARSEVAAHLQRIRDAGGSAWDGCKDPVAAIRAMRDDEEEPPQKAPDKVVGLRADSIDAKELAEQVLAAGGCSRCGRRADPGELPSMIDLDSAGVEAPSWTCRRCVPPLVILGPGGDFTREVQG